MLHVLALVALALPQEPDVRKVQELIDRLDADDVAVRAQAEADLLALGEPAVALLEKARKGAGSERRARLDGVLAEITLPRRWVKDLSGEEASAQEAMGRLEQGIRAKSIDRKQAVRILAAALESDTIPESVRTNLYSSVERHRLGELWPVLVRQAAREEDDRNYALTYLTRIQLPAEAADEVLRILPKLRNRDTAMRLLEQALRLKPDKAKVDAAVRRIFEAEPEDRNLYQILNLVSGGRLQLSLETMLIYWKGNKSTRQSYGREALLRTPPDGSVKEIVGWLGSGEAEDLQIAIDYVSRHKVRSAAGPLAEALYRQVSEERRVAGAPGWSGPRLRSPYESAQWRSRIVQALRAVGVEERAREWLASGGGPPRLAVYAAVGELDLRPLAGEVAGGLDDKDPEVRREAARVLGQMRHAESAVRLEGRLKDESPAVRRAALHALVSVRGAAATGSVLEQLRSDHPDLQAAALEVLPLMDLDAVLAELTKESGLDRPMNRYALAVLVVHHGEGMLHRVVARGGARLSAEDLGSMVRLIQAARGQR